MIAIKEILEKIYAGGLTLPPVEFKVIQSSPLSSSIGYPDLLLDATWNQHSYRFIAEIKFLATPKVFRQAVSYVRSLADPPDRYPMIIVPYLAPERISELEKQNVSGLDLCGNGILTIPGKVLIIRSGNENRYRQSALIRNVYRGETSIVARTFLVRPEYAAVKEIVAVIRSRFGTTTFSTVSKALKRLEEDLIISRDGGVIRLRQIDKLLDHLLKNYEPPKFKERLVCKSKVPLPEAVSRLFGEAERRQIPLVLSGISSVGQYAVMAHEPSVTMYCRKLPHTLIEAMGADVVPTDRFANLEILETEDSRVFFDRRKNENIDYASPVQTWLELMSGDKRQQDVANQVKIHILQSVAAQSESGAMPRE